MSLKKSGHYALALFSFTLLLAAIGHIILSNTLAPSQQSASISLSEESAMAGSSTLKEFIVIEETNELLPDLVPLPPRDLEIWKEDGNTLLRFTTTYFNQGDGPLELRAPDNSLAIQGDAARDVSQRIYQKDGEHSDIVVGTFEWHASHFHYHFTDFITYSLESVGTTTKTEEAAQSVKATFCVRDVSRVELNLPDTPADAKYRVCGKIRQGVSVGWGDSYFYDYPDQEIDITDMPSGIYRLTFHVNPERRFKEYIYRNNWSSVLIEIDMENKSISTLKEEPKETPQVEHVYLEQPFGI